jgi:hypothetical protein
MSNITAIDALNASNVTFTVGQAKAGRNPSIFMKLGSNNLMLGLPRMSFPGGVLVRDTDGGSTSYTLIGTLKGCDPYAKDRGDDSPMGKFYNFLVDLEEKIIASAVENSVKWFGKKRSEEAIRDGFKRVLSISSDKVDGEYIPNGKYPPSFRVKVPVYDGRVSCSIEDNLKNPVYATPDTLPNLFPKGIEAGLVISGSIYVIAGGGFGVTWRLQGAQVFPYSKAKVTDFFKAEPLAPETEEETVEEQPTSPVVQETEPVVPPAPARKRRVAAGAGGV